MTLYVRYPAVGHFWTDFTVAGRRVRESTETADRAEAQAYEDRRRSEVFAEVKLGIVPAAVVAEREAEAARTIGDVMASYLLDVMRPRAAVNMRRSGTATAAMVAVLLREMGRQDSERAKPVADDARAYEAGQAVPVSDVAERVKWWRRRYSGKASSLNRKLATLRAALNHAGLDGGGKIKAATEGASRVRFLSPDESKALFAALAHDRTLLDFVLFLLDTGARRAEALSLEWSDVNLDRVDAKGRPRPSVTLRDSKAADAKPRTIPVSERLAPILRRMFAMRTGKHVWPWDAETCGVRGLDPKARQTGIVTPATARPPGVSKAAPWHAWIKLDMVKVHLGTFASEAEAIEARRAAERAHFRPQGPDVHGLRYAWSKAVEEAGLVDFHMHDCRHDFATRMLRATHNLAVVSKLLGHAKITMTQKYAHTDPTDLDSAADLADVAAAAAAPALSFVDPVVIEDDGEAGAAAVA